VAARFFQPAVLPHFRSRRLEEGAEHRNDGFGLVVGSEARIVVEGREGRPQQGASGPCRIFLPESLQCDIFAESFPFNLWIGRRMLFPVFPPRHLMES
jgi:hypothetical protein